MFLFDLVYQSVYRVVSLDVCSEICSNEICDLPKLAYSDQHQYPSWLARTPLNSLCNMIEYLSLLKPLQYEYW